MSLIRFWDDDANRWIEAESLDVTGPSARWHLSDLSPREPGRAPDPLPIGGVPSPGRVQVGQIVARCACGRGLTAAERRHRYQRCETCRKAQPSRGGRGLQIARATADTPGVWRSQPLPLFEPSAPGAHPEQPSC